MSKGVACRVCGGTGQICSPQVSCSYEPPDYLPCSDCGGTGRVATQGIVFVCEDQYESTKHYGRPQATLRVKAVDTGGLDILVLDGFPIAADLVKGKTYRITVEEV